MQIGAVVERPGRQDHTYWWIPPPSLRGAGTLVATSVPISSPPVEMVRSKTKFTRNTRAEQRPLYSPIRGIERSAIVR